MKRSICDCASNNLHKFSLKSSVHFYTSPSSNLKCYTPMILRLLLCQVYVIHYFKYVIGKMSFVSLSSLHIITMYSYDSAWVFCTFYTKSTSNLKCYTPMTLRLQRCSYVRPVWFITLNMLLAMGILVLSGCCAFSHREIHAMAF